ncbi:hypothetical protein BQ8482_460016 [Mesorhizobium delmotii]|uniref:Transposase n=1 Tax=Mesorhizobium delmotii TaxID=1631247 RepID=A0A2P9ATK3_9HYPH|nr:hypothetical protein BQ8482_460016 [Mesorhizobium delmotii]
MGDLRGETALVRRRNSYTLEEKQRWLPRTMSLGRWCRCWRGGRASALAASPLELIPIDVTSGAPAALPLELARLPAGLKERGLSDVEFVVSDDHAGLKRSGRACHRRPGSAAIHALSAQ